jgi:stress-induced morphogen
MEEEGHVVTAEDLMSAVRDRIDGVEHVQAEDESGGCGAMFNLIVVSEVFKGKPLLVQQRMVNTALKEEIAQIHAITVKTKTPEQWSKMQAGL